MKRVVVKNAACKKLRAGECWIFDNEIVAVFAAPHSETPASLTSGEIADVESERHEYLGRAFVNPASKITARLYSNSKEGIDKGFWKRRIKEAIERRLPFYDLRTESCRLVFAEGDFLPALIIDRFVSVKQQSYISIQFLCATIEQHRDEIIDALNEVLSYTPFTYADGAELVLGNPACIIEKESLSIREKEHMPERPPLEVGSLGEGETFVIEEHDVKYTIDLRGAQKTGHYFDQSENRRRLRDFVKPGSRVLDAFCYTGGFALNAARCGAEVTALDSSRSALETLAKNSALNGVENRVTTVETDVFDYLRRAAAKREKFDAVILDPPAFAKNKTMLDKAIAGYKEINMMALKLLERGGVLVTCTCSHAMSESLFKEMIREAAVDVSLDKHTKHPLRLAQLDFRYQANDHPILLCHPPSFYLKCGFYKVV